MSIFRDYINNHTYIFPNLSCHYIHGLRCDICDRECLNPLDPEQQMGMIFSSFQYRLIFYSTIDVTARESQTTSSNHLYFSTITRLKLNLVVFFLCLCTEVQTNFPILFVSIAFLSNDDLNCAASFHFKIKLLDARKSPFF